jgi:hypothetical protein
MVLRGLEAMPLADGGGGGRLVVVGGGDKEGVYLKIWNRRSERSERSE